MKGVTIFRNEKNNKRILQVDLSEVIKHPDEFENRVDRLIAEGRKEEKNIDWEDVKDQLHKKGKLKKTK